MPPKSVPLTQESNIYKATVKKKKKKVSKKKKKKKAATNDDLGMGMDDFNTDLHFNTMNHASTNDFLNNMDGDNSHPAPFHSNIPQVQQ